ncbi:unnamed protein product [Dicrocoelium dendriticum]|nr:unnamed protein product [Dicrocoelium dendriticum]
MRPKKARSRTANTVESRQMGQAGAGSMVLRVFNHLTRIIRSYESKFVKPEETFDNVVSEYAQSSYFSETAPHTATGSLLFPSTALDQEAPMVRDDHCGYADTCFQDLFNDDHAVRQGCFMDMLQEDISNM